MGPRLAEGLARLNIKTTGDLLWHLPRHYDDYSQLSNVAALQVGPASLQVRVRNVRGRYVRRGLHITEADLFDESGVVKAVWFNQPYRAKQLKSEHEYYASGQYEFNNRSYSLLNPSLEKVSDFPKNTARIVPRYPETKGLKSHSLRKLVAQLDIVSLIGESAAPFNSTHTLVSALQQLHFPHPHPKRPRKIARHWAPLLHQAYQH